MILENSNSAKLHFPGELSPCTCVYYSDNLLCKSWGKEQTRKASKSEFNIHSKISLAHLQHSNPAYPSIYVYFYISGYSSFISFLLTPWCMQDQVLNVSQITWTVSRAVKLPRMLDCSLKWQLVLSVYVGVNMSWDARALKVEPTAVHVKIIKFAFPCTCNFIKESRVLEIDCS